MKTTSLELIKDLKLRTESVLQEATSFLEMDLETLNWKSSAKSWSILECIEHLNLYGDFYLPEIDKRIEEAMTKGKTATEQFNSGILGNYFAKSVAPQEKLNKMKTFSVMDPIGGNLDKSHLDRFIRQQETMLELLEKAKKVNLTKTKTSISISNWIKLRLGDTFRVVIYHNQRHMEQAERVKKAQENQQTFQKN